MANYIGLFGGNGGTPFNDMPGPPLGVPITAIGGVYNGGPVSYVEGLTVVYLNQLTFNHGSASPFYLYYSPLNEGEYLSRIDGTYGSYLNTIKFTGSQGTIVSLAGNSLGPCSFTIQLPKGHGVVAFYGRSGSIIDAIGILYDIVP